MSPVTVPNDRISILLPVFNGEEFLEEQLRSLLAQTHTEWACLIRDDGSSDRSLQIIESYCASHPGKFRLIGGHPGNIGIIASLNVLAAHVHTPYFAFCDQDDVWMMEKLNRCLTAVRQSDRCGTKACLSVSDLSVVDSQLKTISPSFWAATGNERFIDDFRCLPVFNAFPGCTMLGNELLFRLVFPIPPTAPMHDYWTALVARYNAAIVPVRQPLILYRQHRNNQAGAGRKISMIRRVARRLGDLSGFFAQGRRLHNTRLALLRTLRVRVNNGDQPSFEEALTAEIGTRLDRLAYLWRNRIPPDKAFVYWIT